MFDIIRRMFRSAVLSVFLVLAYAAIASVAAAQGQPPAREDPTIELPDGDGRKILETACTTCHTLDEVTKFRGYNTKDERRDIVVTMVKYGAELKEPEIEVLVEYLGKHFSKSQ